MNHHLPGLRESPENEFDVTVLNQADSGRPEGWVTITRGNLTERRKARITRAVRRGQHKGWGWRYRKTNP